MGLEANQEGAKSPERVLSRSEALSALVHELENDLGEHIAAGRPPGLIASVLAYGLEVDGGLCLGSGARTSEEQVVNRVQASAADYSAGQIKETLRYLVDQRAISAKRVGSASCGYALKSNVENAPQVNSAVQSVIRIYAHTNPPQSKKSRTALSSSPERETPSLKKKQIQSLRNAVHRVVASFQTLNGLKHHFSATVNLVKIFDSNDDLIDACRKLGDVALPSCIAEKKDTLLSRILETDNMHLVSLQRAQKQGRGKKRNAPPARLATLKKQIALWYDQEVSGELDALNKALKELSQSANQLTGYLIDVAPRRIDGVFHLQSATESIVDSCSPVSHEHDREELAFQQGVSRLSDLLFDRGGHLAMYADSLEKAIDSQFEERGHGVEIVAPMRSALIVPQAERDETRRLMKTGIVQLEDAQSAFVNKKNEHLLIHTDKNRLLTGWNSFLALTAYGIGKLGVSGAMQLAEKTYYRAVDQKVEAYESLCDDTIAAFHQLLACEKSYFDTLVFGEEYFTQLQACHALLEPSMILREAALDPDSQVSFRDMNVLLRQFMLGDNRNGNSRLGSLIELYRSEIPRQE